MFKIKQFFSDGKLIIIFVLMLKLHLILKEFWTLSISVYLILLLEMGIDIDMKL
jgi:hypothetical protein